MICRTKGVRRLSVLRFTPPNPESALRFIAVERLPGRQIQSVDYASEEEEEGRLFSQSSFADRL